MKTSPWSNYNDSHCQHSACKRACLMTLHVNIYFLRHTLQKNSLENIATMLIFLSVSCYNQNTFPLQLIIATNSWACWTDANINSPWLHRHELILPNLPSNTMCYSQWFTVEKNYFLIQGEWVRIKELLPFYKGRLFSLAYLWNVSEIANSFL